MIARASSGVEPFHQFDRALDVSEESGDRFPLAVLSPVRLHCRLLGEDAFGEVLWGV
jgi:hypothetical protein